MTNAAGRPGPLPPLTLNAWLRWDLITRLLRELEPIDSIVEVGCGGGAMATRLAERYRYAGYEPDPQSAAVAADRVASTGNGEVHNRPLPDEPDRTFDVLVAFEVLEHLEDDGAAMRSWVRWVRPGGAVLLSVPAHQDQFGAGDERVGHFRRYERDTLAEVMTDAGLIDPHILVYGLPLGFALQKVRNAVARRTESRDKADATAESGRWLQPGDRFGWATRLATSPFRLLQRPFTEGDLGTGFVAMARRPR